MNVRGILFVVIVSIGFSASSVLMKLGMNKFGKLHLCFREYFPFLLKIITSPLYPDGNSCVDLATFFYLDLLSKYELNFVYPSFGLVYIFVALAGILFFGERVTIVTWMGIFLILRRRGRYIDKGLEAFLKAILALSRQRAFRIKD